MAKIVHLLRETDRSFDPEITANLIRAFDQACDELGDRGRTVIMKEIIARRIIKIARNGEHDPDRMCKAALASLGLPPKT